MDVLPLYIVLLGTFPLFLWLLLRRPMLALAISVAVYVVALQFDVNLPAYPEGTWTFNPFAWQLLFGFGAWCAVSGAQRLSGFMRAPVVLGLAIAYLVFSLWIVSTWYFPPFGHLVPKLLSDWMYPIDKTNLDVLRFIHFLSLAVLTVRFIPRDWPALRSMWLRPAIVCGQHSLEIFCLGVFLAFAAHFIMVQVSEAVSAQVLASVTGIVLMVAVAWLLSWYKNIERHPGTRPPDADLAGGEA
jgi:hypothetical protein